ERLDDEVVPAHVERHQDVHVVRRGRDEDHRHLRDLSDLGAPVVAVEERQPDVHQHEVRLKRRELLHDAAEVRRQLCLAAPRLDLPPDCAGDGCVVLDDVDAVVHAKVLSAKAFSPKNARRAAGQTGAEKFPRKKFSLPSGRAVSRKLTQPWGQTMSLEYLSRPPGLTRSPPLRMASISGNSRIIALEQMPSPAALTGQ